MKIYLLRHEKRDLKNPLFYSPLLPEGVENAEKLVNVLKKEEIDLIFASPFKRVLQTVKPFCDKYRKKIRVEYSLYEQVCPHEEVDFNFNKKNFKNEIQQSDDEYYLINKNYKSFLPIDGIHFTCETSERAQNFFIHLINKYKNTDKKILLVSHSGIIAQIMNLPDNLDYPMGGLLLYYDNGKYVKKTINFPIDKIE